MTHAFAKDIKDPIDKFTISSLFQEEFTQNLEKILFQSDLGEEIILAKNTREKQQKLIKKKKSI